MKNLPIAVDFETEAITGNPLLHPPKPVGVAIYHPSFGTGEPTYEPITDDVLKTLRFLWDNQSLVFHNAPFDLTVAEAHLDLPLPNWRRVHDTQYQVYLADPYATSYGLKPSAERYLDIPPTEQADLRDWILKNVPKATQKNWGAFISQAPFELVAPYAKQDAVDTFKLFAHFVDKLPQVPYDRERQLAPILMDATQQGVRVAEEELAAALARYSSAFEQADDMLRTTLQAPGLNCSSGAQLGQRLFELGLIPHPVRTPTGQISTDMKKLRVSDPDLQNLLKYRSTLKTLISTFMKGWLDKIEGGRLHPNWNSTRGERAGGTRTGRLSSSAPNFQNIPNPADIVTPPGLPDLPHMRDFILPEEGHLWLKRDFSAQEIRMMAHFERGVMAQAFRDDPNLDPHALVGEEIKRVTSVEYPRKHVKETGFGILYGMGRYTLAERLEISADDAWGLMQAYKRAIPGVEQLQKNTKRRGRSGQPIRTWGGRYIYAEPPKMVRGEMRSFEYKLLNYLIQGSSADQTKQCIIEWDHGKRDAVFMATVHDEINISAPEESAEQHMEWLKECMDEGCDLEVPMRSEGFIGPSWGEVGDE